MTHMFITFSFLSPARLIDALAQTRGSGGMVPQGGRTSRPSSIQTVGIVSEGDATVQKGQGKVISILSCVLLPSAFMVFSRSSSAI